MTSTLALTLLILLAVAAAAHAAKPTINVRISNQITGTWACQDQLGRDRTPARVSPWALGNRSGVRLLAKWIGRRKACITALHRVATVNRNLYEIGSCETGGKRGQNGVPDWDHRARSEHPGHWYEGALGFLDSTWDSYKPDGYPNGAHQASPGQQYAVARILVETFGGYSSWPACSVRLGLR